MNTLDSSIPFPLENQEHSAGKQFAFHGFLTFSKRFLAKPPFHSAICFSFPATHTQTPVLLPPTARVICLHLKRTEVSCLAMKHTELNIPHQNCHGHCNMKQELTISYPAHSFTHPFTCSNVSTLESSKPVKVKSTMYFLSSESPQPNLQRRPNIYQKDVRNSLKYPNSGY